MSIQFKKKGLSSFQIIIIGFLGVILIGSFLLTLPIATKEGEAASFFDALFTAVSATCVTGLVVHDTATYWSVFGQAVILLLIQIGGLGVITIAVSAAAVSGRKIGLAQRSTMQEAIAAPNVGGIVKLTGFILKITAAIELIGACLMMPVFWNSFGKLKGTFYAVFHSVSAFCNAGFDLMGCTGEYSSLTGFYDNVLLNAVIIGLILTGGIGFLTWDDIKCHGFHLRKYRMQSKVILVMTGILILFPFLFYYLKEFSGPAFAGMSQGQKALCALFQTVTPRTAGFNTVDLTLFSEAGQALMILLMLTGGSPGSTAGGMKITTVAVLFVTLYSSFKRKEDTECFKRRIEDNTVKYAVTILLMYLTLFVTGGIAMSCMEGLPLLTCLFETASAIGTVGLTLGITPQLGTISRLILIILMFLGRVGGLTLIFAALSNKVRNISRFPMEKITVG